MIVDKVFLILVLLILVLQPTLILCYCQMPEKPLLNGEISFQSNIGEIIPLEDYNFTIIPHQCFLNFRCDSGYELNGSHAILCHLDDWTDEFPTCIRVLCPDPPKITNGYFSTIFKGHNNFEVGSEVKYSCNSGYELEDEANSTLYCEGFPKDAEWIGSVPHCKEAEFCPDPGVSLQGTRSGHCCSIGDIAVFSCHEDYELIGNKEILCLTGGNWSSPRPLCRPLGPYCEDPPSIAYGIIESDSEKNGDFYSPEDQVEVKCDLGWTYNESKYIECKNDSQWERDFQNCTKAFCERPEPIDYGYIKEIQSLNTSSTYNVLFPFGFTITYICDEGYRVIGDSWRICGSNGWIGKTPHCEEILCPDPGSPANGLKHSTSTEFRIGQKVRFECDETYVLIGSFERYCMPNGEWSGELTRCDNPDDHCPDPGKPINGDKNSTEYFEGAIIGFTCDSGFHLVGSESRECLPNRTWSGSKANCKGQNDFDHIMKTSKILKNKIIEKQEEHKYSLHRFLLEWSNRNSPSTSKARNSPFLKSSAIDSSNEMQNDGAMNEAEHSDLNPLSHILPVSTSYKGRSDILDLNFPGRLIFYFAFDTSGSIGESNFRKSIQFAKAIVKRVGISKNGARAGAITFSSKADISFFPFQYKSTEEVLAALDDLEYTGGGTASNSAFASIREEVIPLTRQYLFSKSTKSTVFFLTDGKTNMGGDPENQADLLKKAGVEINCIGITNSPEKHSLYTVASEPKYKHVFILQNYAAMDFLIEEIADGVIDYAECGLGHEDTRRTMNEKRYVKGRKAVEPWPWMAALFIVTEEFQTLKFICGASIIHRNFLLTAAHCLFTNKNVRRKEAEFVIKLGLTNMANTTHMEEFEVEKFIIHDNFTSGFYDYDMALLKLERPIEFNAFIRPVCLPPAELPAKSTLYKSKEYGIATGWGYEGKVYRYQEMPHSFVENLHEIKLPLPSRAQCTSNYEKRRLSKKHQFTDRMFCAGDGRGADTCKGDSGGPLVQSQLDKDGQVYWTQIGIVSWGVGCKLPNTYSYYTYIQKLMPWLKSQLNE